MRTALVAARTILSGVCVTGGVGFAWWLCGGQAREIAVAAWSGRLTSPAETTDRLVSDLASALIVVVASGMAVMILANAIVLLIGDRAGRVSVACHRLTPQTCRRLVAAMCGITLSAPLCFGAPANADETRAAHGCLRPCLPVSGGIVGLRLPDLPTDQPQSASAGGSSNSRVIDRAEPFVVRRGDSLWGIASSQLAPGAASTQIASLTELLYRRNRAVIGPDPDLIYPGMTLHVPKGGTP